MPESLDLDALREKAEKATPGPWWQHRLDSHLVVGNVPDNAYDVCQSWTNDDAAYIAEASPDVLLAVLALVDELRKALTRLRDYGALTDEFVRMTAEAALAGSSAENKETT